MQGAVAPPSDGGARHEDALDRPARAAIVLSISDADVWSMERMQKSGKTVQFVTGGHVPVRVWNVYCVAVMLTVR